MTATQELVEQLFKMAQEEAERGFIHEATVIRAEADRLSALLGPEENLKLRAVLADPIAVHLNMLRGGIAKPSVANIIHLYGANVLRTALESRNDEEWQPIESAPKDGRWVLTTWLGQPHRCEAMRYEAGDWYWFEGDCTTVAPTHWRPLPNPPLQEQK